MLVKGGRIIDDPFGACEDGAPLPDGPVIVSLKRFQAERDALLARGVPLGVHLSTAETPELIGADIHKLAAIVLHIPGFRDGRAFSWARLLRTRLGFRGEVRVTGHILRDQLAFYMRVGVDAFELTQNLSEDDIGAALTEISNVYQPSVDGRTTIRELRAAAKRSHSETS
ncbi:MAG: DUF934 domain-containing protein [Alphaproteobacteria bacterium]|nr:DUF934 domain-containing protein [Alphaproteobacteria bacterium]